MPVTSPRITFAFFCRASTSRVGGAISPSDRIPVATWYSSGWNRWWVVLAIMVTSTSDRLSALVPNSPPKPEPITTTWWRRPRAPSSPAPTTLVATLSVIAYTLLRRSGLDIVSWPYRCNHGGPTGHPDIGVVRDTTDIVALPCLGNGNRGGSVPARRFGRPRTG